MAKKHEPAEPATPKADPGVKEFRAAVREAAKQAGLTKEEMQEYYGPGAGTGLESGAGAKKIGDGKLLDKLMKFMDFLMKLGPILAPIFLSDEED